MSSETGLMRLWNQASPHLQPAFGCLDRWGVPYTAITEKVTKLASPKIKLVGWLALLSSTAPWIMVMSAACAFTLEPWTASRFDFLKRYFGITEGQVQQTTLESFGGYWFNYHAPKIAEIEAELKVHPEDRGLQSELDVLKSPRNKRAAGEQVVFFTASLLVAHLLPSPLLYPFVALFGIFVGDHLYRSMRRDSAIDNQSNSVHGYESLVAECNHETREEPPAFALSFEYIWSLLAEHINPIIHPIVSTCESNQIPLIQLVLQVHALATPQIKCLAYIGLITMASPAASLPYATLLVTSLWLILESIAAPLIALQESGETYFEGGMRRFDNTAIDLAKEEAKNHQIIEKLRAKASSNEKAIREYESRNSRAEGSVSGELVGLINGRTGQNAQIEEAIKKYAARNQWISSQLPGKATPIEHQAAAFTAAYLAAKFIGHYWIYYGSVSLAGGILLGNHVYHWAKRE